MCGSLRKSVSENVGASYGIGQPMHDLGSASQFATSKGIKHAVSFARGLDPGR